MPSVVSLAALLFLATHVLLWRTREPDYERAFKMARGVAALVLTGLGLAGLLAAWPHWRVGLLYEHAPGDWMLVGVSVAYGHLVADMLSMAFGHLALGRPQRPDLVVHHVLGLVAYGCALALGVGHALVLASLASEVMPCCTGLEAWGRHLGRPAWEARAQRLRLVVLLAWRLPLWTLVVALLVRALVVGSLAAGLEVWAVFVLACLALLVALDVYWVRKCIVAARRRAGTDASSEVRVVR